MDLQLKGVSARIGAALRGARPRRGTLGRTFFSGLMVMLPLLITIAVLGWLVAAAESVLGAGLRVLMPNEWYFRGMGLAVGVILVFVAGLLTREMFFREAVEWFDEQLNRIPMVKTVYSAVRDLTGYFSTKGKRRFSRVVMVQLPNMPMRLLGFVTVEDCTALAVPGGQGEVAVYLPMSYQIGGYTVLMPRDLVTPIEMSLEEAMRFVVTAGMSNNSEPSVLAAADAVAGVSAPAPAAPAPAAKAPAPAASPPGPSTRPPA